MTIATMKEDYELQENYLHLENQIEECPKIENRFVKRGLEYLRYCHIDDIKDITDDIIDAYVDWMKINYKNMKSRRLQVRYQNVLREWYTYIKEQEFWDLKKEMDELSCEFSGVVSGRYQLFWFLIKENIHSFDQVDGEVRNRYKEYLSKEANIVPTYVQNCFKAMDRFKLSFIRKKNLGPRREGLKIPYENKCIYLGYHPDYEIAKSLYYITNSENLIWDFSIKTSIHLKKQILCILNYMLAASQDRHRRWYYLFALPSFYKFCIQNEISDLMQLEQYHIDAYKETVTGTDYEQEIKQQIVERVMHDLFIMSEKTNWEANVWYLERFEFDEIRYNPTNVVNRISFLEIKNKHNRKLLQNYVRYQIGVCSLSIQKIFNEFYMLKDFISFFDGKEGIEGKLDLIDGVAIDSYFKKLEEKRNAAVTFNNKVNAISKIFQHMKVRGIRKNIPFYSEYYIKKAPYIHHYRAVPKNTVTEILTSLGQFPEHLRLMYLHLWCLGLRINEVCMIKKNGYYVREGVAWLRIYQNKLKMEKVIPMPMLLYKAMMIYCERCDIKKDAYVFSSQEGRPYTTSKFWRQMVNLCKQYGITCGEHIFQTHDYRHSVATMLYEYDASLQVIREFLGHQQEDMTKQYIDCIPQKLDEQSKGYYKEKESLAGEWVRRKCRNENLPK